MPRDWNSSYETYRQATTNAPIVLLDITTGVTGTTHIYITSNESDYSWDGKTWVARPYEDAGFTIKQGEFGAHSIEFSDADGYWTTWLLSTDFRFEKVTRHVIERNLSGVTTGVQTDVFRVSKTDQTDRKFMLQVEPLQGLLQHILIPMQLLTKDEYPGIPDERMSY